MSKEEMVDNLGVIARSGSLAFLEDPNLNAKDKANAIIGQVGCVAVVPHVKEDALFRKLW
jgi:HSP90 family molecular chaperone